MPDWSRRDLLKATAGAAAIAVPMAALSSNAASAASTNADGQPAGSAGAESAGSLEGLHSFGSDPVMFCVHDAAHGEVSILHGENEVVVTDRQLVARIMRAATSRRAV